LSLLLPRGVARTNRLKKSDHPTPYLWDHLIESEPEAPDTPAQPGALESVYRNAFRQLLGRVPRGLREVKITYYPYRDVQAKIARQNGVLRVRLSEMLEDMPEDLHRALALVLVGKMERKPYPKAEEERLDRYLESDLIRRRMAEKERLRPRRPQHYGTQGWKFDLVDVFDRVNRQYFGGKLPRPGISWTRTQSKKRMGYVDEERQNVYISRWLDRPRVPRYVIEYVMFHELLHLVYPSEHRGKRTFHHTKTFHEAEKIFKDYAKALRWLGYQVKKG